MNLIASNLKAIRKHHKLTQEQFATKIGIKRASVGAYEEGRADPPLQNLKNISKIFEVSMDSLVFDDFQQIGINPITGQRQKGNSDLGGIPLKVLSITVDQDNNENIDFIPQKAAAGYLNGYADPEFLKEMPKFHLPNLPTGSYRAFEISGDSMHPLPTGSIVIGKYIESLQEVKNGERYVVVSANEGVVFKRIFIEENQVRLVSDNAIFSPYSLDKSNIIEIWKAHAYISTTFPVATQNSMDLETADKITELLEGLKKDIQSLRKK